MDKVFYDAIKNGKDADAVLRMPINYVMEVMAEEVTREKEATTTDSLIAAFGG